MTLASSKKKISLVGAIGGNIEPLFASTIGERRKEVILLKSLPVVEDQETTSAPVPDISDESVIATAYQLLLRQPGLNLEQFAQRLRCDTGEARNILDRLVSLSLLSRRDSEYGTMVAVSPIVAMQRLIAQEQVFLDQRHRFLDQGYGTFSTILAEYATNLREQGEEHLAEPLVDLPEVRRRLEELASTAQEEVLSLCPAADNPTATRAASRSMDLLALQRGVALRTVYPETLALEPAALDYAHEMVDAGGEVHLLAELPMRLIIIDRRTAIIPRDPNDSLKGALVIRNASMIHALVELFERCWRQGRPLPRDQDAGPAQYTFAERAVVQLLATGAKDDAVARHLGTSVRTVRRIIADLMVRAGTTSRFALGVYAAQEWL